MRNPLLLYLLPALLASVATVAQDPAVLITLYKGCYALTSRTILPTYTTSYGPNPTTLQCILGCYKGGRDLFQEVSVDGCNCAPFQGTSLPSPVPDTACNTPNATRIYQIYPLGAQSPPGPQQPTTPVPNPGGPSEVAVASKTYKYVGCFKDRPDSVGRALPDFYSASTARTNAGCVKTCAAKNFAYAATENGNECRCGNLLAYISTSGAKCDKPCSSNNGEKCGGYDYSMSLFHLA